MRVSRQSLGSARLGSTGLSVASQAASWQLVELGLRPAQLEGLCLAPGLAPVAGHGGVLRGLQKLKLKWPPGWLAARATPSDLLAGRISQRGVIVHEAEAALS